jgi:REP-associated tyrosine transposase
MSEQKRHCHLQRLSRVWLDRRDFLITTCTPGRRRDLADERVHAIFRAHWERSLRLYGWAVGRYVIMPDHVHFFCTDVECLKPLSLFVGKWKEWTSKGLVRQLGRTAPTWQPEFFDHLLRSNESYKGKWAYVRENPVRAGLAASADDWPYQGYIDYD